MNVGNAFVGICGASKGGILKLAAMVKESRRAKSTNVVDGIGRGVTGEKSLVKFASFHKPRERLVSDVAANLAVPWVVLWAGLLVMVEEAVSMALAAR
jgi:hypothetical protein